MGASGSGKTTLATALAERLRVAFVEGDALHPPANVAKMSAGIPLDDEDRAPFLDAVARALQSAGPEGIVVSCSALKRRYRDRIRAIAGAVAFVLPIVPRDVLVERMRGRSGHYMPTSLLQSQLATLEPLQPDEPGLTLDGTMGVEDQVAAVVAALT